MNQSRFLLAIAAGFGAALVATIIWSSIAIHTGYKIGWVAIGVGYLIGISIFVAANSNNTLYGILGGGLSLLACLIGNLVIVAFMLGRELEVSGWSLLWTMSNPVVAWEMLQATNSFFDILMYCLAGYVGFRSSYQGAE